MAYEKKTWKSRTGKELNRFSIDGKAAVTLVNAPISVDNPGDSFNQKNMNALETRIESEFVNVNNANNAVTTKVDSMIVDVETLTNDKVYSTEYINNLKPKTAVNSDWSDKAYAVRVADIGQNLELSTYNVKEGHFTLFGSNYPEMNGKRLDYPYAIGAAFSYRDNNDARVYLVMSPYTGEVGIVYRYNDASHKTWKHRYLTTGSVTRGEIKMFKSEINPNITSSTELMTGFAAKPDVWSKLPADEKTPGGYALWECVQDDITEFTEEEASNLNLDELV